MLRADTEPGGFVQQRSEGECSRKVRRKFETRETEAVQVETKPQPAARVPFPGAPHWRIRTFEKKTVQRIH
jgi:hypothetical protein